MTMAEEEEEHRKTKKVSEFIQKSCLVRPSCRRGFSDFFRGITYTATHPIDRCRCKVFPVGTGSLAELYIEPMLSCIDDSDVMYHYGNELAIPAWHTPPTQLPLDFENRVKVYEIIDSRLPGYVYLNLTYILKRNECYGKYIVAEHISSPNSELNHELYVIGSGKDTTNVHGPAYRVGDKCWHVPFLPGVSLQNDSVLCIRCFVWPLQAADWPTRHRNYNWPDEATVDRVVSNGCDVVGVAHHQCRQDEWMSKHQWRMSFSRAEIVLLNSWMPVQQIVYHMLRAFVKTERLTDSADNSGADKLSNYHIKTMMLWACEVKPQSWWNDGSTFVRKCVHLLQFLDEWLTKKQGQHYFISNAQLLHRMHNASVSTVIATVRMTTDNSLAQWFVDNYIRKCAEVCPDNISLLCSDLITSEIQDDTINAVLQWRDYISGIAMMKQCLSLVMCCVALLLDCNKITPLEFEALAENRLFSSFELHCAKFDATAVYFSSISTILDFMNTIGQIPVPFKNAMVDFIALVFWEMSSIDDKCELHCLNLTPETRNISSFQKAIVLMETVANECNNAHRLARIELSKAFLYRILNCDSYEHDFVHRLANVYLSVLHYKTGKCQQATDHWTLAVKSRDRPQSSPPIVRGKLLPKFDDNVDIALGLVVLHQHVRSTALNHRQQAEEFGAFTMDLFAHYFAIKHLFVAKCHTVSKAQEENTMERIKFYLGEELKLLFNEVSSSLHLFTSDVILCKLCSNSRLPNRHKSVLSKLISAPSTCGRRNLVNLMTELSLEQLLACRNLMLPRDTEEAATESHTDVLMALYLYRCQLYEQCEQLCRQTIHDLIDTDSRNIPRVSTTYEEFIELMDDHIVSLIGLTQLLDRRTTGRCSTRFKRRITVSQLTLSLYLFARIKLHEIHINTESKLSLLATVLDWIADVQQMIPADAFVDHLMLKLAERKLVIYIMEQLTAEPTTGLKVELVIGVGEVNGVPALALDTGFLFDRILPSGISTGQYVNTGRMFLL